MSAPYFLGIDIGTQGARVVLIDATGELICTDENDFALTESSRQEQSPAEWWQVCFRSLKNVIDHAATAIDLKSIKAIAVTSTSGTVIPLDEHNDPLHHAIMYSDKRSAAEGEQCRQLAVQYNGLAYTGFNSSSGLSKMVWFVNQFPDLAGRISKWVHAADFITGKLTGIWGVTDYTNALKSGYDLRAKSWPGYLWTQLPLKKEWLPEVVPSGAPLGTLDAMLAALLGLASGIEVVAGITDGCASQLASGAVNPGDWNTTIGTTMVIKGVTRNEINDPEGRLYNHRHPEGYWMPGGAANIGADWVTAHFKEDLAFLEQEAQRLMPTSAMVYPLMQQGERFPFISPGARGFTDAGLTDPERFTASMEGVAYIERYAYEMITALSGEKTAAIYTAGGGSNSDAWLRIRSNVLNLPVYKMKHITGAVGAAILAASKTYFSNVMVATAALTKTATKTFPEKELVIRYNENYRRFVELLEEKGYLKKSANA